MKIVGPNKERSVACPQPRVPTILCEFVFVIKIQFVYNSFLPFCYKSKLKAYSCKISICFELNLKLCSS